MKCLLIGSIDSISVSCITSLPCLSGTFTCSRMLWSFASSALVRLAAASTSLDMSCKSMDPPEGGPIREGGREGGRG